ncbi:MAG: hypothetical protein WCF57_01505 [Pyrinomonadaceae bacterium]
MKLIVIVAIVCGGASAASAQSNDAPLTSQEIVRLVYQLPKNPGLRDEIIKEIRRRGIGFPLTDGLRGVVATKSGNDALLRRTLEEAERRRLNPTASTLPPEAETTDVLEKTRNITLAAADAMPDFVVKELVTRSLASGSTQNWRVLDHLSYAVSYRAGGSEDYKLLAINGQPPNDSIPVKEQLSGGATSAGEFVLTLSYLFDRERTASFKAADTDVLRGRRTVIYEFQMSRQNSRWRIMDDKHTVISAYHGRVWVDRETWRVLRLEMVADLPPDVPAGFYITQVSSIIDYDWITIGERQYLLPVRAENIIASSLPGRAAQARNEIRFRNYQKFGTEVKIIEDDDYEDEPEEKKP